MLDPPTPEPSNGRPSTDLTRRTFSGLRWMYLGTGVGVILQFGMTAVLARLLTPAAFGLIAFAALFLRFVDYFADAGVTQALIQKASLSQDDVRAAFTLSLGLAVFFAATVFVAAPLAGVIGQDPALVPVVRWLSLGLILSGLGSASDALLQRELRFKPLAAIQVGSYTIGYVVVGLAMAATGAGVYALVAATLTQTAVGSLCHYALVRHSVVPSRARESYRAIFGFGARISIVGFLEFLQGNLDTLAIGRWAGAAQLGLYNRANMLADLPAYHLTNGLAQVLFPSFSAIQHDRRRILKAYLSGVGMTSAIIFPLNAGIAVAGEEIVLVMLGSQWVGAIEVLPWLLLASSIALVGNLAGVVTEAQAALNAKMVIAAISAVTLGLLLLLAEGGPLAGYGAALAATAVVSHLGYLTVLTRTLDTELRTLIRPYANALVGAALVAGAIAIARLTLLQAGTATVVVLIAEVATGAIALALSFRFGPLRGVRAHLARRLTDGGLLQSDGGPIMRVLGWLVGPPGS